MYPNATGGVTSNPTRCHTGHGFNADALLDGLTEQIDKQLWETIRGVQEEHLQQNGASARADIFQANARELDQKAGQLKRIAVGTENLGTENMEEPNDSETHD